MFRTSLRVSMLLATAAAALAGGGPQNVLIVVNDESIDSQQVGVLYRQTRGIPERNICHVSISPRTNRVNSGLFQTSVVSRIHQHIADHGLSNQIDFIVLSKDIPYAARWSTHSYLQNGTTAVIFYGLKDFADPDCQIHAGTDNAYFQTERAFHRSDAYAGSNYYLCTMLTARWLNLATALIARTRSADGTFPSGEIELFKSSDPYRNIRYRRFDDLRFSSLFFTNFPLVKVAENQWNAVFQNTNLLGYCQGVSTSLWIYNHVYLPGAICDHFTSYGGSLFDAELQTQMSILDWIQAGASASYGTVVEPCSFLAKFPDPMVYFWQYRGFNLAECYWMSVKNPYQGVFLGDPLMAPYATPPLISITNLLSNEVVAGVVTMEITATTNSFDIAPQAIDLYVDDLFVDTLTNTPPAPGNLLKVSVNSTTCSYTVVTGDTLLSAVSNLAVCINSSNLIVRAQAFGDRLQLVYTNYGYEGTAVTYGIFCEQGTAGVQRVFGQALSPNLIESTYIAREYLLLRGTATAGDWVRAIITLTNGAAITNRVNAAGGESAQSVMTKLKDMINTNAVLSAASGVKATNYVPYSGAAEFSLDARFAGPAGYRLRVAFTVSGPGFYSGDSFADYFNDNADVLTARGNILFRCGQETLTARYLWDSTNVANGPHTLRAVARDGTAVEIQGHCLLPVVVSNSAFACSITSPTNGQDVLLGDNVAVTATAANAAGSVTQILIYVEGKLAARTTSGLCSWNSRTTGVGRASVQAVAYDSAGGQAISEAKQTDIRMSPTVDSDGDGVADAWEQHYFGWPYFYEGTNDLDGDGQDNYHEFIADTDPSNAASRFNVALRINTNTYHPEILFVGSTARVYQANYTDEFSTNWYAWSSASTSFIGMGMTQIWEDDGTATLPHPSSVVQRLYRMKVALP